MTMAAKRSEWLVVVPQKSLAIAKTRLRSVLALETRMVLTLQLLRRALQACAGLPGKAGLLLCGPPELAELASEYGAALVPGGTGGMRRDLLAVSAQPRIAGRAALLIVSSDLPFVSPAVVEKVVAAWRDCADVVLCPDRRDRGTNVMMVNEPERFPYAFGEVVGPGSCHTHRAQAEGTGLCAQVLRLPELALDIDLPDDLAYFIRVAPDDPLARYAKLAAQEVLGF
jgi:2-phospho-L-lactate guanylyltransferase